MQKPKTARLSEKLKPIQERWIESDRQAQDTIHYRRWRVAGQIRMCEFLNIGKGRTFGLGKYESVLMH